LLAWLAEFFFIYIFYDFIIHFGAQKAASENSGSVGDGLLNPLFVFSFCHGLSRVLFRLVSSVAGARRSKKNG
jgi:hypothetical protein